MINLALSIVLCCVVLLFPATSIVLCIEIEEYYPSERDALLQLRDYASSASDLHSNWTGPPCVNSRSRWSGIACSNWHVVDIVLEEIQLTGSLPPTFLQNITFLTKLSFRNNSISGLLPYLTNLVHLEYVSFSYNRFSGSIPVDYIELPNLKVLQLQDNYLDGQIPPFNQSSLTSFNVSYNHLGGQIPSTSVLQRFSSSSYDHNSDLCGKPLENLCPSPPPAPIFAPPPSPIAPNPEVDKRKKSLQVWNIALIAAAAALVPFVAIVFFLCYYKRVHEKETPTSEQTGHGFRGWAQKMSSLESTEDPERTGQLEFFNKELPGFDLDDLLRASAEVLGKGNLGTTYKATLETGQVVTTKRLKNMNDLTKKEFLQQMQLLGNLRHENLVDIISFYYSKEEKLVIYEFVPNGTLFELLHENKGNGRAPLDWATRHAIVKEIAKGLAFLHQSLPSHKVPHANLKSSNVLIHQNDRNCHSKLTDFGFLPLLPTRKLSEKLAISKSPEFAQGKKLTHKADVYCFGIILLEIITGRIPGEISGGSEETTGDLSDWVRMVVNNDWSTDILDVEIQAANEGHDEMLKLTEIALECTDMTPEKRPKMSEVLRRIEEIEKKKKENE
ncbi:LRR receptor-like kinase [Quillaja saponaria]|uniref:LRR receptor-like kinase n=1 Tax=Quillaja saponaria TaxID=32244 RepID=A0AAD7Q636_QUISA|nr:LRR receptor-like kinase [Quillaja saponaria]